jgi:hypothetical protein
MDDERNGELEEFHRRIESQVHGAEDHLKIPHGSIWAVTSDNDFVCILKTYGIVEPLLKEMIREHLKTSGSDAMTRAVVSLPMDQLRTIALELNIITHPISRFTRR